MDKQCNLYSSVKMLVTYIVGSVLESLSTFKV